MDQYQIDKLNDYYKSIDFPYEVIEITSDEVLVLRYNGIVKSIAIRQTITKENND